MVSNDKYKHLTSVAKKINKQFDKALETQAVLLNGSLAWGCKEKIFRNSDIDLDVIIADETIPDINLELGKNYDHFRRLFTNLYQDQQVDYASWKAKVEGIKTGLHFVPLKTFRYVCTFPFHQTKKTTCLKEFRLFPKEKKPIYCQSNFQRKKIRFNSQVKTLKKDLITFTPLAIIKNNLYYNGLLPDKYLTYPIIGTKSPEIHYLIFNLKRNLFLRLIKERHLGIVDNGANLSNLAHARSKIPKCEISHLNLETNVLEIVV